MANKVGDHGGVSLKESFATDSLTSILPICGKDFIGKQRLRC
jgi:hypothetical protein